MRTGQTIATIRGKHGWQSGIFRASVAGDVFAGIFGFLFQSASGNDD
jgi:hypothetical protein